MNSPFKIYFDQVLNRCEFEPKTQKGMLFFLAVSMMNNNLDQLEKHIHNDDQLMEALNNLIFLYSIPTKEDSNLFHLEFEQISKLFYTVNYLYLKKIQPTKNEKVEELEFENQENLLQDFIAEFQDKKYTVATNHQIVTAMFNKIGDYLEASGLDEEQAYKAGLIMNKLSQNQDYESFNFLISNILKVLSPLYRTLFKFPYFFVYDQNRLNANHLFSSILQFFYLDANREIAKNIHAFHNYLFLKPNSVQLKKEWDFENTSRGQMISQMLFNSLAIRNSPLMQFREDFLKSDQFIYANLKDQNLKREDFIRNIQFLMEEYYESKINEMIEEEYNHGEYLQFLAILFYEATAHAMLPKEITLN